MQLTDHFTLDELISSQTAERRGINNYPSDLILGILTKTAHKMECVRAVLNAPIYVTSGYRSRELNKAIGGSTKSHHCLGLAVDFKAPKFGSPKEIVQKIKDSGIQYDQLIYEGSWVHISFAPAMRRQTLTAKFSSRRTVSYQNFS